MLSVEPNYLRLLMVWAGSMTNNDMLVVTLYGPVSVRQCFEFADFGTHIRSPTTVVRLYDWALGKAVFSF